MNRIIGREKEIRLLQQLYETDRSEFVALYGRRRVGKTFLIKELFSDRYTFQMTGLRLRGFSSKCLPGEVPQIKLGRKLTSFSTEETGSLICVKSSSLSRRSPSPSPMPLPCNTK